MLDIVQLRTLTTVLDRGSFAAAAAALRYTPSAVSQQMSALERACGVALFERLPRGITPTPAALTLAARSRGVLDELDELERSVHSVARGQSGQVRLGAFPTAGARLVPPALAALAAAHPRATIALEEGEPDALATAVVAGLLDIALVYQYDLVPSPLDERLIRVDLLGEHLYVLSGVNSAHSGARLSALSGEHWVAPLSGAPGAVNLDRLCAAAGFRPQVRFRSNDYGVVRGLVGAGLGVAIAPTLAVVDDPRIRATPIGGRLAGSRRAVFAVHRSSNRNPLLAGVLDALRQAAEPLRAPAGDS